MDGMLRVPSDRKKAKATLFPLVLAADTPASIWSSPCPCHVPASLARRRHEPAGNQRQMCARASSRYGRKKTTVWRRGDNGDRPAADDISIHIKRAPSDQQALRTSFLPEMRLSAHLQARAPAGFARRCRRRCLRSHLSGPISKALARS